MSFHKLTEKRLSIVAYTVPRTRIKEISDSELKVAGYARVINNDGAQGIRRINAIDSKYAKLTTDDAGKVVVDTGSDRLSRNGLLRERLTNGLTQIPLEHQAHHIIPDAVVQQNELFQEAVKYGYDLDRTSNGALLVNNKGTKVAGISDDYPIHQGSHPVYNQLADDTADNVLEEYLIDSGKNEISQLTPKEVLNLTKEVENRMINELKKWGKNYGPKLY